MTAHELIELLTKQRSRFKEDAKKSHHLIISFECLVENEEEIERFVDEVQAELDRKGAGLLDIFGIDSDLSSGEFLIRCSGDVHVQDIFKDIRPIFNKYSFFEYSYAVLYIPNGKDEYESVLEVIKENRIPEDDDPELPVPAGVDLTQPSGCLGSLALLLTIGCVLIACSF